MESSDIAVFLSLGSNQGDQTELLKRARERIEIVVGRINKQSSIYETVPWGMENAPLFLNQVIQINTSLSPLELLSGLLGIEKELGRSRIPLLRYARNDNEVKPKFDDHNPTSHVSRSTSYLSRSIDIDILFYGEEILDMPELTIPHPLITERRFVLVPLAEIAGELCHPVSGTSITSLLASCNDSGKVRVVG
ncbi:MAG: 2-amino-4-hydroxy-6-hydroxymethyldihydropteridine diphosphokinase [Bacteroidetes bacterium]|nr:2-amino-4-hydroxy-6-hydroxymethyldihydropteridine diphosphokinase [Bacteroidota bacterium]